MDNGLRGTVERFAVSPLPIAEWLMSPDPAQDSRSDAVPAAPERPSQVKRHDQAQARKRERQRYHELLEQLPNIKRPRSREPSGTIHIFMDVTAEQHRAVMKQAELAQIGLSNLIRLQVLGRLREPPRPTLVVLPPRIPPNQAHVIIDLATTVDVVVRAWAASIERVAAGGSLDPDDRDRLRAATRQCSEDLSSLSPM